MTVQAAIITLVAAIISGVLATVVTIFVNAKREERQMKRRLVEEIFGNRYVLSEKPVSSTSTAKDDFSNALNKVPIVFNKDENVMKAYDEFYRIVQEKNCNGDKKNDALITFMKALCVAARIDCSNWNDSRITNILRI